MSHDTNIAISCQQPYPRKFDQCYIRFGEGNHGYLGLVLMAVRYNTISNTPYVQAGHPGAVTPVADTQHKIITLSDNWKRGLELFKEIASVEKAIKNQIVDAIDKRYVKTLIDRPTRKIQEMISKLLDFFGRYGKIWDEDLREKEEEIKELKYELVDIIVNVFNEIEDLRDLVVVADN